MNIRGPFGLLLKAYSYYRFSPRELLCFLVTQTFIGGIVGFLKIKDLLYIVRTISAKR